MCIYIYIFTIHYQTIHLGHFLYQTYETPKATQDESKTPSRRGLGGPGGLRLVQHVLQHVAPHGGHEATFAQGLGGADHVFGVPQRHGEVAAVVAKVYVQSMFLKVFKVALAVVFKSSLLNHTIPMFSIDIRPFVTDYSYPMLPTAEILGQW